MALLLVLAGLGGWWLARPQGTGDLRGVRLGLSAADTRARFVAPGPGTWTSESNPEPALRWTSLDRDAPVREAVFEFHQGMLVAVRLHTAPGAPEGAGPPMELTPARVLARSATDRGTDVTVLSRNCPTHAAEVARLLARP